MTQMIEISRAAAMDNLKILVLDEPTSSLGNERINQLHETVNRLSSEGITIIYITHKLEEIIKITDGASSEYQVMIDHMNGRDIMTVFFETSATGEDKESVETQMQALFKAKLNMTPVAKGVALGELPRSEKKTRRIFDNRY